MQKRRDTTARVARVITEMPMTSNRQLSYLLKPAGPEGSGHIVLCAHDPLTGQDHRDVFVTASDESILIVDSVFAFRPEYNDFWITESGSR